MKTLQRTMLFQLAFALFLWANTAMAQMNTIGVTVYADCNYAGASASLPAVGSYGTNYLLALGLRSDNTISSVRVAPGYEVVLFDNDNFTGDSITITATTDCLVAQGWNDRASSLKVRAAVTLYRDCNYTGVTAPLPVGSYTASDLERLGIGNNNLSSLRVRRGYEVVLFDGDNFTGRSITITANTACLAPRWNNRTSSLQVRVATPPTPVLVATFYRDCAYGGRPAVPLEAGSYTTRGLEDRYIENDDIASVRVRRGYQVVLFDGDNFTGDSLTITADTECLTAAGWTDRASSLKVRAVAGASATNVQVELYPNPAASKLYLTSAVSLVGSQYRILNGWGRPVASGSLAQAPVDVAGLPEGVYTLVVVTKDGHTITRRFMK
ncbi:beta/gamma crystallin-related protein [Hymenobacter weizhouensis]|uniref:beta/gamma crystallin-related protein n=1 Tax=Hymenobacter sp. YIM 151500-1 TaxID=2987689 RepID=UPI0022277867|nr:beta/gamma crystallin-related protein [Hymenobacter sp. YIM 151500-1]UYZ63103.1 beta/gamma crystallin-related protein [Hymenobacter sp. YIM 151500-1]